MVLEELTSKLNEMDIAKLKEIMQPSTVDIQGHGVVEYYTPEQVAEIFVLTKDFDPIEKENQYVRKNFNLEEIIEFQESHSVQIIRGGDYQYSAYIDGTSCGSGLTPLCALIIGIQLYKIQD